MRLSEFVDACVWHVICDLRSNWYGKGVTPPYLVKTANGPAMELNVGFKIKHGRPFVPCPGHDRLEPKFRITIPVADFYDGGMSYRRGFDVESYIPPTEYLIYWLTRQK